jgi:hypothetical protein
LNCPNELVLPLTLAEGLPVARLADANQPRFATVAQRKTRFWS